MSAADRHVAALVWDPDGPVPDDYQDRIAQIEATGEAVERAIFRLFPFDRPPARPVIYARRGNRRARRTARRAARHGASTAPPAPDEPAPPSAELQAAALRREAEQTIRARREARDLARLRERCPVEGRGPGHDDLEVLVRLCSAPDAGRKDGAR